jgi:pimeloyl-ACP methyl ester carboxylesterase
MEVRMSTVLSPDGTEIAFDRLGDGPPVVLVGGAFQHRAFDPRTCALADLLARDHTVIHYDRRGRGSSTDTEPYAVQREVEDLGALIDDVGGSACVFGMSSGACLALEAVTEGLPITKLAAFEAPLIVDDTRPAVPEEYPDRLAALLAADRRGEAVELFLRVAAHAPPVVVATMREAPTWPGFEEVAHTLLYEEEILGDRSIPAGVAEIGIPTLVADGGASPAWLRNAAASLAHKIPAAEHRTLEGQTHAVDPRVLAPALVAFYAGRA